MQPNRCTGNRSQPGRSQTGSGGKVLEKRASPPAKVTNHPATDRKPSLGLESPSLWRLTLCAKRNLRRRRYRHDAPANPSPTLSVKQACENHKLADSQLTTDLFAAIPGNATAPSADLNSEQGIANADFVDQSDATRFASSDPALEFVLPFGIKVDDQQSQEFNIARELIARDQMLQEIPTKVKSECLPFEESLVQTRILVTARIIQMFGHPSETDQPFFRKVVPVLVEAIRSLAALDRSSNEATEPEKGVYLDRHSRSFYVDGELKEELTDPQKDVLEVLYEAGDKRTSAKILRRKASGMIYAAFWTASGKTLAGRSESNCPARLIVAID